MTKDGIQQVIAAYFVGKPVLKAYLFGLYARGDADEYSDIDVLIELDYANGGADFGNYLNMVDDLAQKLGKKVDLVSAKGLSKFVAPYIHRDKVLIYERQYK